LSLARSLVDTSLSFEAPIATVKQVFIVLSSTASSLSSGIRSEKHLLDRLPLHLPLSLVFALLRITFVCKPRRFPVGTVKASETTREEKGKPRARQGQEAGVQRTTAICLIFRRPSNFTLIRTDPTVRQAPSHLSCSTCSTNFRSVRPEQVSHHYRRLHFSNGRFHLQPRSVESRSYPSLT
jgi:hypothetical protein